MPIQHFRVVYDGDAVSDGEMDVGQLASSLLALGKLIEQAENIRSGESGRVRVRVKSDIQTGSFDVGISIHVADAVLDWLKNDGQPLATLLSLLGIHVMGVSKGVVQLVRWMRGRRVSSQTVESGKTTIEVEDGEKIEVNPLVARMATDPLIRTQLEKFTAPLREDGVQQIRFEDSDKRVSETITEDEQDAFTVTGDLEPSSTARFEATYQIKRLFFERGRKWRLYNGSQTIQAEITDEKFWKQIDRSEATFAKDDYLVCLVRMDQWITPSGLKMEYVIEQVLEHRTPPKQINLV
ncbi:MAG: hypothetical protein FGM23_03410 [Alphaproteobacteria bacterium]|nr:hypothetical protein [Alphaproteobacteria bacterium]